MIDAAVPSEAMSRETPEAEIKGTATPEVRDRHPEDSRNNV